MRWRVEHVLLSDCANRAFVRCARAMGARLQSLTRVCESL